MKSTTTKQKRKAPPTPGKSASKKAKTDAQSALKNEGKSVPKEEGTDQDTIPINRAPVLDLWSSCVTHFLYPELPWVTCLSVGGAISTITAIAKGRSIGRVEKPEPSEAAERRMQQREKAQKEHLDEIEVMHFNLRLRDGKAFVGDKLSSGNEATPRKKFGDEPYAKTKSVLEDALRSWKGKEEDLDRQAFKMYEKFRPSIPAGAKGWGRKGQLNLQNVKDAIKDG
jgi:hypothetical protein